MLAACDAHGLALVPLVAPTTPPERLAAIGARARGFLYTVSVVGTTGERAALAERFAEVVARAKAGTAVPVALGFGISTPEQARQAARAGADGVIVGTRLVRAAGEAEDPAAAVGALWPSWRRGFVTHAPAGRIAPADGIDPHRHRRPGRLDRALGARRQGLRRVHARRRDHAGRRLA